MCVDSFSSTLQVLSSKGHTDWSGLHLSRLLAKNYSKAPRVSMIIWRSVLGWSIEASTLEKPRPRPRISRVFEAEGQIFLHFRGPIEAEGSLKVQGFFEGVPRRTLKLWGEAKGNIFEDFRGFLEKPRKNDLFWYQYSSKIRGFSRILEKIGEFTLLRFFRGYLESLEFRGWGLEKQKSLRKFRG